MDKQSRIKYIDYAKAVTIFLVVVGHCSICPNFLKQWLYSFHMPLFYAFYGMTWSFKDRPFKSDIFKKVKRLVIPFVIWSLGYTFVTDILNKTINIKHIIYDLYGSQMSLKSGNSLTSLWFLSCLFIATIIFDAVMNLIESGKVKNGGVLRGIFLTVSFCLGFCLSKIMPIGIGYPWCLNVSFMAMFFIQIGYYSKTLFLKFKDKGLIFKSAVCFIAFILTFTYRMNLDFIPINNVDMASSNYGNPLLFLLTSLAGIVFVITFCIIIDGIFDFRFLSFVGMNTMAVMFIHKPVVKSIKFGLGKPMLFQLLLTVSVSAVVTAFSCLLAVALNKYLPFTLGVFANNRKRKDV